jgi:hypothetical protein
MLLCEASQHCRDDKKADVGNRPQAFYHVGLPIDKQVGQANPFFNMSSGIYQREASRRSEPA